MTVYRAAQILFLVLALLEFAIGLVGFVQGKDVETHKVWLTMYGTLSLACSAHHRIEMMERKQK